MITQAELKEALRYDPQDGNFYRLKTRRRWKAGQAVGTKAAGKRQYVSVDGKFYLAHRLAWLYMTGEWPSQTIDHKDGDPQNNRFDNLRHVPQSVNLENQRGARSNSKTGVLGVHQNGRFIRAQITVNKKPVHLGYFKSVEAATDAYLTAKRKLHEGCTI